MYTYSWVTLLSTWNYHIVDWLCCYCLVTKLCLILCDPMDCSLPGSSVREIFLARILELIAVSFSRDLPDPGIESTSPALRADLPLSHWGSPWKVKTTCDLGSDVAYFLPPKDQQTSSLGTWTFSPSLTKFVLFRHCNPGPGTVWHIVVIKNLHSTVDYPKKILSKLSQYIEQEFFQL